ncbi:MAG: hypothetical protein K0Q87_398 [Neobacillus sp.]|nr:hypothetical protein [Neobacillus sp.]
MGRKVFVSYKFADNSVENLNIWRNSSVRDYVDEFETLLDSTDHIYKGEEDDEDLSSLSEETIWNKLKDRIYDSTLTVIFISPNMKESYVSEKNQWIPWEVSYSLKETSRKNKNGDLVASKTNAMIALVLPDSIGSYSYFLEDRTCCANSCVTHHTDRLFQIIRDNKFNLKDANKKSCDSGRTIWYGDFSYIGAVKWKDFKTNVNKYINAAYERQDNINDYDIVKTILE